MAEDVHVAVAANFSTVAREIASGFERSTGHHVVFSFGSTGQLYTQISQGAPYEVFLAADQARPERAETEGLAVPGSRFTYAIGRLVLFSPTPDLVNGPEILRTGTFERLAIANPVTAPYGAAAAETLRALGAYHSVSNRLVALSQVIDIKDGSRWLVPASLHAPIAQDAVLLKTGAQSSAAQAFLDYLKSADARAVIIRFGYGATE
jgi:molybdate transport system substrate-binding protein